MYLSDRRRFMLDEVLPGGIDVLADKDVKQALLKISHGFGCKLRKLLTEISKDKRELLSLLQTVRRSKNILDLVNVTYVVIIETVDVQITSIFF